MNCNYCRIFLCLGCSNTTEYCGDNQSLWNKLKTCGYFPNTHKHNTRKHTTTTPGFITILSLIQSLSNKISAHSAKRILFFFYFPFQRNIAIQDGYKNYMNVAHYIFEYTFIYVDILMYRYVQPMGISTSGVIFFLVTITDIVQGMCMGF